VSFWELAALLRMPGSLPKSLTARSVELAVHCGSAESRRTGPVSVQPIWIVAPDGTWRA